MRRCSRCGLNKPVDEFPLRKKGAASRHSYCRACKAVYQADWYRRNKRRHVRNVRARNRELRASNRRLVHALKPSNGHQQLDLDIGG